MRERAGGERGEGGRKKNGKMRGKRRKKESSELVREGGREQWK